MLSLGRIARWASAGIAILVIGLFVACGDDEGPASLTPEEAQAVADAALFVVGDLPEGNWDVADEQANLQDLLPVEAGADPIDLDVPEQCQALVQTMSSLEASVDNIQPVASSGRSFSDIGDTLDARVVSTSVLVFAEEESARAASNALAEVLDSDGLEDCLTSALGPMTEAGISIEEFRIDRPDYALDGAAGLHIQVEAVAFILPINLGIDVHIFNRGHALAMYLAFELNGEELAASNAELLAAFAQRVEEAQP